MDQFELPDDLKDDVEVIYLEEGEEFEEMEDYGEEEEEMLNEDIEPMEVIDLARLTFRKHEKPVFNCDLTHDGIVAITGGQDDMAYLWSTDTGNVIMECTGHKDSITEVAFNYDCQLVATGDMAGLIQVWSTKDYKLIWCYEGDDLEWLIWHHLTNVLISGSKAGEVYIFQVPQGNCKVLPSHGCATTCAKLLPDGKRILVGYHDGQIRLWDIKETSVIWQLSKCVEVGVTSIDVNADGTVLAAAPTGHIIKVHDGQITGTLLADGELEIEAICFNSELGVVATGGLSGQICVWEMGKHVIRHQARIECSVIGLEIGKNGRLLIAASDGAIYVCDLRTGLLVETLTGHQEGILSTCVCKDGSFVLSTSDDGTAKIFNIKAD